MSSEVRSPEKAEPKIRIEIGCGGAAAIRDNLAARLQEFKEDSNLWYFGIDIDFGDVLDSKEMVEYEAEDLNEQVPARIKFIRASGDKLPFKDGSVSDVLMRNVLGDPRISLSVRESMIREGARVLKRKGTLTVVEDITPQVTIREGLLGYAGEVLGSQPEYSSRENSPDKVDSRMPTALVARLRKVIE